MLIATLTAPSLCSALPHLAIAQQEQQLQHSGEGALAENGTHAEWSHSELHNSLRITQLRFAHYTPMSQLNDAVWEHNGEDTQCGVATVCDALRSCCGGS